MKYLKGARELNDLKEQSGKSTIVVISKITLTLEVKIAGSPKVAASDANESPKDSIKMTICYNNKGFYIPMIMEYARAVKKHMAVIPADIIQAEFSSTDFAHVSWNDLVLCCAHALPMRLKL